MCYLLFNPNKANLTINKKIYSRILLVEFYCNGMLQTDVKVNYLFWPFLFLYYILKSFLRPPTFPTHYWF